MMIVSNGGVYGRTKEMVNRGGCVNFKIIINIVIVRNHYYS